MKKLLKNIIRTVLPLLLGGFILYWVYRDFDFSKVGEVLRHGINWWWMVLSLVFGVFSHIFRGWRWKLTLEPLGEYPKTSNSVYAIFISYAANLVLPRLGEISRCGVLAKYDGVSFTKSLGTVVTERLIDTLCVGLITLFAFVLQFHVFQRFFNQTGTDFSSFTDLFTSARFYIILLCIIGVLVLIYYMLRKFSVFEKIRGAGKNIWEGIISLKSVKKKPLFIFYTILIWLFYFLQFYVTIFCFPFTHNLGILAALVLFVCGSIAVVVPTPNGAGPWHFAVISMMVLYGVGETEAGIFALIVHGIQTFLVVLLGIYGLAVLPFTNKKKAPYSSDERI